MPAYFRLMVSLVLISLCTSRPAMAQEEDPFAELDTLTLIDLIDSLLLMEDALRSPQINVRMGYTSRVITAGRDFGLNQYGLSPSISYFHTNGLFTEFAGYYNSELDPKFNFSVLSFGYVGLLGKNWSFITSYDRIFYHENRDPEIDYLDNTLNLSAFYGLKHIEFGGSYSFLFGDKDAHRLQLLTQLKIKKSNWWKFKSVSFKPTASILWGNVTIYTLRLNRVQRLRDTPIRFQEGNSFGLMNWGFNFPLTLATNRTSFLIGYQYNLPQALEGEGVTYSPYGFVTASIGYTFNLK